MLRASQLATSASKLIRYVAHTVEDATIPLARDTQDEVGDALDEGQPQATRANLENNSKVPRVSKEVESARAFVITSTLSDEASDKEGSDEQEDEHAPSPPTAGQNAGRVQALEQEIADLIATLQVRSWPSIDFNLMFLSCAILFFFLFAKNCDEMNAINDSNSLQIFFQSLFRSSLCCCCRPLKLELRSMLQQLGTGKHVPSPLLSQVAVQPPPAPLPRTTIRRRRTPPLQSHLLLKLQTVKRHHRHLAIRSLW